MWYDVTEVKRVRVPMKTKLDETIMVNLGTRITLANGIVWFHSSQHDTWSCQWPPTRKLDRTGRPAKDLDGTPIMIKGEKFVYKSFAEVRKAYTNRCKQMISNLERAG